VLRGWAVAHVMQKPDKPARPSPLFANPNATSAIAEEFRVRSPLAPVPHISPAIEFRSLVFANGVAVYHFSRHVFAPLQRGVSWGARLLQQSLAPLNYTRRMPCPSA
jgi:hypothetical protein